MKPFVLMAIPVAMLMGCGEAPGRNVAETLDGVPRRSIRVGPVFSDQESSWQGEVIVKNTTGQPVSFTEVSASCACTEARLDTMELTPGAETKLHLAIDVDRQRYPRHITCLLMPSEGPPWPYDLEVVSYMRVQFDPVNSVSFGNVIPGRDAVRKVLVQTHALTGDPVPAVDKISASEASELLRIRKLGNGEVADLGNGVTRRVTELELRLDPRKVSTSGTSRITVQCGSVAADFDAYWRYRGPYVVTPKRIVFRVRDQNPVRSVQLRRQDGLSFSIESVDAADNAFSVEIEQAGKMSTNHELRVSLDRSRQEKHLWTRLSLVVLSEQGRAVVQIPVSAIQPKERTRRTADSSSGQPVSS